MKKAIIIFFFIWPVFLFSQNENRISLEQCMKSTSDNYPLSDQKELLRAAGNLKQQLIQSGFLPQINLNGQVSYQSDVTYMPISIPNMNIPKTNKDWYKLNVDISQLIYDGGALKKQQELNVSNTSIELQSIEIELYKVKEMVQTAFFNIILLNENKNTILILQQELSEKLKNIESGVRNGAVQPSSRDNLKAELIKIEQHIDELELSITSAISSLNILTGLQLTKNFSFIIQEPVITMSSENNRPEMALFDMQISQINLLKNITALKRKPMIFGFGQAGYGRPALNMLSNNFEPYFIVGAKFSWKVFDWGNTKKERKSFDIQSQIINKNKEAFDTQLKVLLTKKQSEIKRLESLIIKDNLIVSLKANVARASSSQFENGQITATEYLLEKNEETKAKLNLQLHQIQLRHAQIDYEFSLGNIN